MGVIRVHITLFGGIFGLCQILLERLELGCIDCLHIRDKYQCEHIQNTSILYELWLGTKAINEAAFNVLII